ncbi:MAG: T9SS type A sorting domain-containing protein [Bacteroidota bacterium]
MTKILYVVMISLLATALFAETPDVDMVLTVTSGTSNRDLNFGLDPLATDARDTSLSEAELPPPPPDGVFDVRFTLQHVGQPPSFQGLAKDYRQGSASTVGTRIHRLKWKLGAGQTTINFAWNLPAGVTGTLKDLFGGIIVNVLMSGSGNFTNTQQFLTELEMTINYDGSLPIQLANFTAVALDANSVQLNWMTVSETSNYGFEVQRSTDGVQDFQTVANSFVPGNGTTIEPHSYTYTDQTAYVGTWYYRLKQIDLDGTTNYTDPIQVDVVLGVSDDQQPLAFGLRQNYPNPFNPSTKIKYSLISTEKVTLTVYNLTGQLVANLINEVQQPGVYSIVYDASALAGGVYFYRLEAGKSMETRRFILLK